MVKEISSAEEFKKAISVDKLVVVDFYATWCGPCKMIAPMLEKFDTNYEDADFYKVDVDALSDVAQEQQITSMPTLIYYKNGEQVSKVIGADVALIRSNITKFL
ncbi:thioredoxin TRX2 Ecym_7388 [Eremothecium cymbalariae DBVPG|uniref:Thioredoxin n=1 Tax=Eremothecium cymbalariae (strain CBS 270.75 / DBVPG 7215 / KCTC 17166 / NRRL Y-17582) TaxID=931890 RepID=G8JWJ9_ERECY|nr:hypothetical protein Ecym_7388 [Eremothecium cymbalariae DBVPG\